MSSLQCHCRSSGSVSGLFAFIVHILESLDIGRTFYLPFWLTAKKNPGYDVSSVRFSSVTLSIVTKQYVVRGGR